MGRYTRGVKRLDQLVGLDWPSLIDTDTLDLSDQNMCVLGQALGQQLCTIWGLTAYHSGYEHFTRCLYDYETAENEAFDVLPGHPRAQYAALTEYWRGLITRLRTERHLDEP